MAYNKADRGDSPMKRRGGVRRRKKVCVFCGKDNVIDYEADGSTIERYNKGFEAVQAMQQGKIDAVVIDQEPAKVFVSQNEGIKILDEALTVEEYAIAIKKGNTELLDQVNGALAELKESGELQAIIDKYISAE